MKKSKVESLGNKSGSWKTGKLQQALIEYYLENCEDFGDTVVCGLEGVEEIAEYYSGNAEDILSKKNPCYNTKYTIREQPVFYAGFYSRLKNKKNSKFDGIPDKVIESDKELKEVSKRLDSWLQSHTVLETTENGLPEDFSIDVVLKPRISEKSMRQRLEKIQDLPEGKSLGETVVF